MEQSKLDQVFLKAAEYHQNGQLPEAEKLYKEILAASPDFTAVYGNLAEIYLRQGKGDPAFNLLKEGEKKFPDDLSILTTMCAFNAQLGNTERALMYALKVVKLNPSFANGHFNLGNLYMQMGRTNEALEAFKACVALDPVSVHSHLNIGVIEYGQKNLEASAEAFLKVIESTPDLAQAYLNLGIVRIDQGRHEDAMALFEKTLSLHPANAEAHKRMGMILHVRGDVKNAVEKYEKALELGSQGLEIQMLLGNGYRDLGDHDKAKDYFKKVLAADPENKEAKNNLQFLSISKISSWHFEMLADAARNSAYYEAILNQVKEGDTVLDIGTGSGLLAMMAVKAGAKKVYACELVSDLSEVARIVVADNEMSEKIEVFNMKSNALKVGEHLPEKADVVVSEILDCGLLAEGVLPSLRHAYADLLKPGALSVPRGADVYGVLMEVDHLKQVNPVREIAGFNLSAFERFRMEHNYQRVDLRALPHRRMSEVFHIHSFDFQNLPKEFSGKNPFKKQLQIPAIADGTVHGVAFWFTLHIDEKISLSTGPKGEMIHWGQALQFLKDTRNAQAGSTIDLTFLQSEVLIAFE
ncbi:MAG: tetratricopeptide repeat protein [Bacteroidota bacterium]